MAAASPFLLRSRVYARAISSSLRPCKSSIGGELSPSLSRSSLRPSEDRVALVSARLLSGSRCLSSMLPLHSAIASARLKSVLSAESQPWGWVPQGMSTPL